MGSLTVQKGMEIKPIEEGRYDARLIGLVGIGLQKQRPYKGEKRPDVYKVKFIFEIPNLFRDDGKTTEVISKTVTASTHEKGNFAKYSGALSNKSFDTDYFTRFVENDDNLKGLIGNAIQIDIAHFEIDGKQRAYIANAIALDPRIECAEGTRETFVFFAANPNMVVWPLLTYYSKSEIMGALDAKDFSKELHKQWAKDQEAEEVRKADKASSKPKEESAELGAIQ